MPRWTKTESFSRDLKKLSDDQHSAFCTAVGEFVEDLKMGGKFRAGLRVAKIVNAGDIWEMTWAEDGRATFEFTETQIEGERHVVWRRIGTHEIYKRP